jgi:hypothetical protein
MLNCCRQEIEIEAVGLGMRETGARRESRRGGWGRGHMHRLKRQEEYKSRKDRERPHVRG